MNNFSLIVNGFDYKDCWKSIAYSNSMENFCGSLTLNTIDFFEGYPELWNIKKGSEYVAKINDEDLSIGYIDDVDINYSKDGSDITFSGRDKTSDLVDCPYGQVPLNFKNQTVGNLIKKICLPFGIDVTIDSLIQDQSNIIIKDYTIDEGRSCSELIMELCGDKGILPISVGDGKLTLTQATLSDICSDMLTDTNIISCNFRDSNIDRFRDYTCKAEGKPEKTFVSDPDYIYYLNSNKRVGKFTDSNIKRYRPFNIITDIAVNTKDCQDRAKYEANIRAAKGCPVNYTVEGWTEVKINKIWRINKLVSVNDDKIKVNELMLINSLSMNADDSGWTTNLNLVRKECYSLSSTAIQLAKTGFSL